MREFEPGRPQVFRTVAAVRRASGERPAESEILRYEREGFVEGAIVRLHSKTEPPAKGISGVFEFETSAGSRAEMRAELKEELDPRSLRQEGILTYLTLMHFKVPGVSKAIAFAFVSDKAADEAGLEVGVAKAVFTEGNCLFSVGVLRPRSNEVTKPLISGLQAVSRRTDGACA